MGDGKADDTAAIQKALDSVGTPELKHTPFGCRPAPIALPARWCAPVLGVFLIGEHPDRTILRWDGPAYDGKPRVSAWRSPEWDAWDGRIRRKCSGSTAATAASSV